MSKQPDAFDLLIQQAEMLLKIAAGLDDGETRGRIQALAEECRRVAQHPKIEPME